MACVAIGGIGGNTVHLIYALHESTSLNIVYICQQLSIFFHFLGTCTCGNAWGAERSADVSFMIRTNIEGFKSFWRFAYLQRYRLGLSVHEGCENPVTARVAYEVRELGSGYVTG